MVGVMKEVKMGTQGIWATEDCKRENERVPASLNAEDAVLFAESEHEL